MDSWRERLCFFLFLCSVCTTYTTSCTPVLHGLFKVGFPSFACQKKSHENVQCFPSIPNVTLHYGQKTFQNWQILCLGWVVLTWSIIIIKAISIYRNIYYNFTDTFFKKEYWWLTFQGIKVLSSWSKRSKTIEPAIIYTRNNFALKCKSEGVMHSTKCL